MAVQPAIAGAGVTTLEPLRNPRTLSQTVLTAAGPSDTIYCFGKRAPNPAAALWIGYPAGLIGRRNKAAATKGQSRIPWLPPIPSI